MERFDEISTRPQVRLANLERYLAGPDATRAVPRPRSVCATAGTTDRRGVFMWDAREIDPGPGLLQPRVELGGPTAGLTHRVSMAVVGYDEPVAPVHPVRRDVTRAGPRASHRHQRRRRRHRRAPERRAALVLVGYALEMLRLFAEEQLAGRLRIAPRFVFSASEVLTDATRALARRRGRSGRSTSTALRDLGRRRRLRPPSRHAPVRGLGDHRGRRRAPPAGPCGNVRREGTGHGAVLAPLPLIRYEMSDRVRLAADQRVDAAGPTVSWTPSRVASRTRWFPGLDGARLAPGSLQPIATRLHLSSRPGRPHYPAIAPGLSIDALRDR